MTCTHNCLQSRPQAGLPYLPCYVMHTRLLTYENKGMKICHANRLSRVMVERGRCRATKQQKPAKAVSRRRVPVTMTLPPELLRRIDARAEREERPRSKVIEMGMRKYDEDAAA